MRFLLGKLSLLLVATSATAHDFWLQPQSFQTKPGVALPITALIGHGDARGRWEADAKRVLMLKSIGPSGTVDLRRAFTQRGIGPHFAANFPKAGVYTLVMQTNNVSSELPSKRFNDYARDEGLTPILQNRKRIGTADTVGREFYSRRAKALIRVGANTGRADPRATKAVGLTLVLPGATVKLTNLNSDEKPVAIVKTNSSGRATFRIPESGVWLLNVVWTKPIKGRPSADYDTIFSSLTFGYN
jgi:hypothetical protein